ncbi:dienelactone hydrolase [Galactobacter valiniphilus]|uniref:Dienelactone hydrolase n=1 Tax=Galactobacter valiniphilus TaxID=2676122 RepID=A0A399J901_9MICC|nr:dienelactone hydrolase family protein [Galactobacter valiniphilus]RII42061.1 dienelactone hydrolase [Galactobacter valiniphilus]
MAQLLLLHHVRGITAGVRSLANAWRSAGHEVVVPDLLDGRVFDTVPEGVDYARSVGFETISARGEEAAADLSPGFVVLGLSLGAIPAMRVGVGNDAVAAVILAGACLDEDGVGAPWPRSLPLRVLASEGDEDFVMDGDLAAAEALVARGDDVKLRLMPGQEHLFMDAPDPASLAATETLYELVLRWLERIDESLPDEADIEDPVEDDLFL